MLLRRVERALIALASLVASTLPLAALATVGGLAASSLDVGEWSAAETGDEASSLRSFDGTIERDVFTDFTLFTRSRSFRARDALFFTPAGELVERASEPVFSRLKRKFHRKSPLSFNGLFNAFHAFSRAFHGVKSRN